MNRLIIPTATLLLAFSVLAPVSGYHIMGNQDGSNANLSSGDWFLASSPIIVCESDGPLDPRNANPTANAGQGGLCSTGQNMVTGVAMPSTIPSATSVIRLDVCSATTKARSTTGVLPPPAVRTCAASGGSTAQHGYTAELGAFSCFVPTDNDVSATGVRRDFALYYRELYAWWTWEWFDPTSGGSGLYLPGHLSVFPDATVSKPLATTSGSVETAAVASSTPLTDFSSGFGTPLNPVDLSNNCDSSPACPPGVDPCSSQYGPVIRAPNTDNPVPPPFLPPPPPPVPPVPGIGRCSHAGTMATGEPYTLGGTAVVRATDLGVVDQGGVVMLRNVPLVSPLNVGGFCWYQNTALVVTDAAATDTAFQVCLDMNLDGFCLDAGDGGCRDIVRYSHQDGTGLFVGTLAVPMAMPTATAGCPGSNSDPIVFICEGVHVDGVPHVHPALGGTGTVPTTGTPTPGFTAAAGGFCQPLVAVLGKPYVTV